VAPLIGKEDEPNKRAGGDPLGVSLRTGLQALLIEDAAINTNSLKRGEKKK